MDQLISRTFIASSLNEEVTHFRMTEITVDGISSSIIENGEFTITPAYMFSIHPDAHDWEYNVTTEYLDESCDRAEWSSPYNGEPYENGDIDEELWLKLGFIVGKDSPAYDSYKEILEQVS